MTENGKRDLGQSGPVFPGLSPVPPVGPLPPWAEALTAASWPALREDIRRRLRALLGEFPTEAPPLDARWGSEAHGEGLRRVHLDYAVENDDRATAWLLLPDAATGRVPGIVALHPSTQGTGKERILGLAGRTAGSPPEPEMDYAVQLAREGYAVLAPDVWGDGERLPGSGRCRDTREFYAAHPDWSYQGKIVWDSMRAVDVLQSLPQVDAARIGMAGHSLGGHTTVLTAALDDRVRVAVANGSTSAWYEKHQPLHWALDDSDGAINCFIRQLRPYLTPERWREIPVQWTEILSACAPRPFLNTQGGRCPHDDPETHWRHYGGLHAAARQVYEALGAGDRLAFLKTDEGHTFPASAREAMRRWFRAHL